MQKQTFDVAIAGGGLAGLALSIQLAGQGYRVALFEKETYPFHKVCGEYISMESWDFLQRLGIPLPDMNLPLIKKLEVTAPNGTKLAQALPLGGFGISRYTLDDLLKQEAVKAGVELKENCRVRDIVFSADEFYLQTAEGDFYSRVCCGSFGKRSNLDLKWKRNFIKQKTGNLNNYIGIKYHIRTDFPDDTIALHNFNNGYCGLSKVDDDRYCLCYLTNAQNLKDNDNSIAAMEKNVLQKNPFLQAVFNNAEFLYASPLTISQISFSKKAQVENHVLFLGDAAGMIAPLCGNGMSMALHSSQIATGHISSFLSGAITRENMEAAYTREWKQTFNGRLRIGRWVQLMFGKEWITNIFIGLMKKMPFLTRMLIRQTHGKPF